MFYGLRKECVYLLMEQGISYNKYLQVLLILSILVPEGAALFPDQNQEYASTLFSYKLLSTSFCNRKNLDMSDTCPDPNNLDLLIKKCRFECPAGEKPVCVNTQQRGSAYVCLPKNLTCEKGVRWIGWVDKEFQNLNVREEVCPTGTFRAYKSDCFQACTAVHVPLKNIPEKYKVFSEGDSMSHVYCNYLGGYCNTRNITLFNYDQDSMHNPHFCQHVDVSKPCKKGKIVLAKKEAGNTVVKVAIVGGVFLYLTVSTVLIGISCLCKKSWPQKKGNIKKNKTIVNGNLINIYSSGNVQINKKNVPDEINKHDSDDLNVNEHDLEDLKEYLNKQDDIGLLTSEQTRVKELLQALE